MRARGAAETGERARVVIRAACDGQLGARAIHLSLVGSARGKALEGCFVGLLGESTVFQGSFQSDDIARQVAAPAPPILADKWGPVPGDHPMGEDGKINIHEKLSGNDDNAEIEYDDDKGKPIPGSTLKILKKDKKTFKGGAVTVYVYAGSSNGTVERPKTDQDDAIKAWQHCFLLIVQGCTKITFFQFNKAERELTGQPKETTDWHNDVDPTNPKAPYENFDAKPGTGMVDQAGLHTNANPPGNDILPKEKHPDPADLKKTKPLAKGDVYKEHDEFVSFICCDGALLGSYAWYTDLTYTYDGKNWSEPVASGRERGWDALDNDAEVKKIKDHIQCPK